jgi:prepilin-type N-terminal cleavage/methylation domain-containing protein
MSRRFVGRTPWSAADPLVGSPGVTLIEMLIVMTLIGLMVGISFPAISSGIDSLRLSSASGDIASFINGALNRAERRQELMELTISKPANQFSLESAAPGFVRKLAMPSGVTIAAVYPDAPPNPDGARRFLLYPGGTVPRIAVEIVNRRGARRVVRVDPITGVPVVERVN